MARTHIHYAYIETGTEDDADDFEVEVVYTFSPGCPEQGPSYACGGQPADPPEVDIQGAYRFDDKTLARGEEVTLSDADEKRIHQWLIENHEPEERE